MKTIYLECNMGAAGDMLMSALYEICDQKEWFLHKMNTVFAPYHIALSPESAVSCGISGTHMKVTVDGTEEVSLDVKAGHAHHTHAESPDASGAHEVSDSAEDGHSHTHTTYAAVCEEIASLDLPAEVKDDALAIYRLLGEAEAKVHDTTLAQIHFHEVGTLDALADVVGCALLIRTIAPEQILASPLHVGNGFVKCAHGVLPVPAPATAELLRGIPFYTGSVTGELLTPTGAAILHYYVLRYLPMPTMTASEIGYGIGSKDFGIANCVRAFLGDTASYLAAEEEETYSCDDTILSISCNIDDMTGEALGLATEIFMAAGALDVFTIPIQMKKNRPGILLTCLCEMEEREKFTGLFFLHTSTRGVRYQVFERAKLESTFETRKTSYGNIRIKKSSGYGIQKEKAEFEDLKSVVLKNHCALSLNEVEKSLH